MRGAHPTRLIHLALGGAAPPHAATHRRWPTALPGTVACCYALGVVTGRVIGTLWVRGPSSAHGMGRLVAGLHPEAPPTPADDLRHAA